MKLRIKNYELKITRKSILRSVLFLFLFTIPYTLNPHPSFAQDKGIPPVILSVSPVLLSITLSPDQVIEYPITLTNQLDSPLPVKVNFADFKTATEDGGYQFVDTKTDPLLSWVSAPEDVFILQPKEKKEVIIVVKTPKTIPFGGYYGMVYFEPVLPSLSGQTKVLAKIAVLMLGSVGVFDPNATNAEILNFTTPSLLQQEKTVPLLLRVKNTAINHFSAKPFITVQSLFGKTITYQLEDKYVFPSKVRRWQESIDAQMHTGVHFIKAAVSIGGGKQLFAESMIIVYPTNQTLLIIAGVLLLLIAAIYRNRLRNAVGILLFDKKEPIKKSTIITLSKPVKKSSSKKKKKTLDSRIKN